MRATLKPRDGLLVRHPARGPVRPRLLKAEGEEVVLDRYWMRRLAAGDVVETKDEE